jgi:hypothetical protein
MPTGKRGSAIAPDGVVRIRYAIPSRVTLADGAQRFILDNLAPPPKAPPPAAEPAGQAEVALIAVEAMTLPPQPVSYKLG